MFFQGCCDDQIKEKMRKCALLEEVNTQDWCVEIHSCVYVCVQTVRWRYVHGWENGRDEKNRAH